MREDARGFIHCDCGKRIIRRDADTGALVFRFGVSKDPRRDSIVEMHIKGTVRMRCLNRGCDIVSEMASGKADLDAGET